MRPRDLRSDGLKAAAITGVVMIHAGFEETDPLCFCVPVFIALWAYFYELGLARRTGPEVATYVRARLGRLVVPYAFWTALYLLLLYPPEIWRSLPLHTLVGGFLGGYGWSGQYFFILLFQLTAVFPWLRSLVRRKQAPWLVLGTGLFSVAANYFLFRQAAFARVSDRLFIYWLPYVLLGIALARGYPRPVPWLFPVALGLLLGASREHAALASAGYQPSPYLMVTTVFGSVLLLWAVATRHPGEGEHRPALSGETWLSRLGRLPGRSSFAIYVAHVLFLQGARRLGWLEDYSMAGFARRVGVVLLAILASLLLGGLLRRIGLGILVGA